MAPMPLHEAIRTAYAGRARQEDIADKIGINQSQISRWSRGENLPTLEQLAQIEDAAGRPRGFILNAAGLTSPVTTVREAVAMDPNLSDDWRRAILAVYDQALEPDIHQRADGQDRGPEP